MPKPCHLPLIALVVFGEEYKILHLSPHFHDFLSVWYKYSPHDPVFPLNTENEAGQFVIRVFMLTTNLRTALGPSKPSTKRTWLFRQVSSAKLEIP